VQATGLAAECPSVTEQVSSCLQVGKQASQFAAGGNFKAGSHM
jgi:hypothetical protein